MATKTKNPASYAETDIQSLDYPENIQRRPGMYVGGTGVEALHHLAFEAIDNAVDEAMAGACTIIDVKIHPDGSLTVIDNGRGIPAGLHPEKKKSTLELVFTELHTGGKFGSGGYSTSGGLHGVGIKATNALSSWLEVATHRDGVIYEQRHERGLPTGPVIIYTTKGKKVSEVGKNGYQKKTKSAAVKKQQTKTIISFQPNPDFLDITEFDFDALAHRLQEIAFQIPGVVARLTDERRVDKEGQHPSISYQYKGGLIEWVEFINEGKTPLHKKPIHVRERVTVDTGKKGKVTVDVEIAMQYHTDANSADGVIISTVNTIPTPDGGKHVSGFRAGLTKAVNTYATEKRMTKKGSVTGKDVLYGLTAIVKLLMPDPQFTSQTKTQLASDYVQGVANSITYNAILEAFRQSPSLGRTVVQQSQAAAQAREAESKVRASIMRKSILEVSNLPGKLADCDSRTSPLLTALYIVEGDSAGGSCKLARDRRYHAILPTRGKILNVWRANLNKAMGNNEISAIISAIGGGVGSDFELDDMRYGMIVIMVDADVDGGHIGSLLLTLGFKFMRRMVAAGRLYWAVAPLYQISKGKKQEYAYSDQERDKLLKKLGAGAEVQRYKGLGEMNPEQLRETVFAVDPEQLKLAEANIRDHEQLKSAYKPGLDEENGEDVPVFHPVPLNRHLVQVKIEEIHAAETAVDLLMGSSVAPRKAWLMDQMSEEGA